ncbi:MAG: polysaccharide biosynthesis tyrosine autokinase [Acidobacteriaceae bacterium]|nr:polysaccharide biosynthesis tyrosine autokinase [Acidobacteriaceae bacterium]
MNSEQLPHGSSEAANRDSLKLADTQELQGQEYSLGDYWLILRKRKWIVLGALLVVLVIAALIAIRTTPLYEASTKLQISREEPNPLHFRDNSAPGSMYIDPDRDVNTQVRILQSDSTAELVVRKLHLDENPAFAGKAKTQSTGGVTVSESSAQESANHEKLIRKFRRSLKVQQIPDTSLIEIRYADPDPTLAAEVANTTATSYIEQNIKSRYESTMQAANWLSRQLADLQIKMEISQARLIKYQHEHNIIGVDDKQNLTTEKLEELNKELTGAQADRIQKESLFQTVMASNPEAISAVLLDPVLQALRQRQTELQAQYALLSTQFGPSYPRVRELQNELNQVNQSYKEQVQSSVRRIENDFQTSANHEHMLQSALTEQANIAQQLNESAIEYKLLKQEADSNRQIYDGLLQQLKEASLAAGMDSSNIRVVDSARVPSRPISPNIPRSLEFALLIGLIGGIAIAFGLDALDITIRTPEQAESILGLPTLGMIPLQSASTKYSSRASGTHLLRKPSSKNVESNLLISHLQPQSEVAEAYRALRTSILLSSAEHPPRSILITSPTSQDGKTMTCINIAIVLAQQGKKILLLDADLRRPNIHKAFDLANRIGLSNVLTGGSSIDEALQATSQSNLFVIPAGPIPPHPAELLGSKLMYDLVAGCCKEYDHVIVDSPPALSVTDPVLLSVQMNAVLLIVRSGKTTSVQVRRIRSLLQSVNAEILGVVVNAANLNSPDFYYYHYGSTYESTSHYEDMLSPSSSTRK